MDFTGHSPLVDKINQLVREELNKKGFTKVKRVWDSSLLVYSAFKEKNKRLIKIPSYDSFDILAYDKEVLFLSRLKGLEGITNFLGEIELSYSSKHIKNMAMIKEYVRGNSYSGQYLNSEQEQKAIDTVKEIHKEGVGDLDIKKNNYIYFPEEGLTFIDPIYDESLDLFKLNSRREVERIKSADLDSIEGLFKKSKGYNSWN